MCIAIHDWARGAAGVFLGLLVAGVAWGGPDGTAADTAAPPAAVSEPGTVDLRPVFEKWNLPPRSQGERPTCSVFTVAGAIEYALAQKRQQGGLRLSVDYLNWASNRASGRGEDGSLFSDLWEGFERYGACPEEDMPYQIVFTARRRPSKTARATARAALEAGLQIHWIKLWDPNKGLSEAEFAEVKKALAAGWPGCGGFLWPKDAKWTDGLLEMAPRDAVRDGHSVLLVGYRDDASLPGGGAFFIHNSSGPSRRGRMSYEYVRAYANDAIWIAPAAESNQDKPAAD